MVQRTTNATQSTDSSSVLPDDIREAIALGSFTSISGQPSSLSNLAYGNAIGNTNLTQQNAVSNQQAMNALGQTVAGQTVSLLSNLSPLEAAAAVKLDTGNDMAEQLADLQSIVAGFPARTGRLPLPRVRRNSKGGFITTVSEGDFPLTLNVLNRLRRPFVVRGRRGGMLFFLKPSNFPLEISFGGDPRPVTPVTVPRSQFPVTFVFQSPLQTAQQQTRITPKSSFPLQIILGEG